MGKNLLSHSLSFLSNINKFKNLQLINKQFYWSVNSFNSLSYIIFDENCWKELNYGGNESKLNEYRLQNIEKIILKDGKIGNKNEMETVNKFKSFILNASKLNSIKIDCHEYENDDVWRVGNKKY